MDDADKRLCDLIQNEFPVTARPYQRVGERLEMSEDEVLERVTRLRSERIIRQISAIFDTRRLGYTSCLVAARSTPETADEAAEAISSHPGVTHNYEREHDFNIWFTIGVPPNSRLGLDRTIELLGEMAEVESIRPLPALKFFKIGVDLDMKGGRDPAAKKAKREPTMPAPPPDALTVEDIAAVRALQGDLRAVPEPFAAPAQRAGLTVDELLARAAEFHSTGQMRRFAAVLYHRSAGLRLQRHGRLEGARPGRRRGRLADGLLPRRVALLPAADLPGLALQPVLDDARAHQAGVRGRARRDLRRDRPHRPHGSLLHQGVEEDPARVLLLRRRGVGAPARARARRRVISRAGAGERLNGVKLPPFQSLLSDHGADVHRMLRAMVGPNDADDCWQETFLSALRAYPGLRSAENLRGWLMTIAHRKALDAHRARKRHPVPVSDPPERAAAEAPDKEPELWTAVRRLPVKQRTAVTLRFAGDLSYMQIGEIIGCSEAAARQNVRAGLAGVRREWVR